MNELIRQNPDVVHTTSEDELKKIRVVTKKTCRNPIKENWILQAHPNIAKWFLKREMINFDLVATYVQEYLPLTICFKCCGFGHVAKYCKKNNCCHKCGEEHMANECQADILNCPNCRLMGLTETEHSARNQNCPTYKRKLDKSRQYVNYGQRADFLA